MTLPVHLDDVPFSAAESTYAHHLNVTFHNLWTVDIDLAPVQPVTLTPFTPLTSLPKWPKEFGCLSSEIPDRSR